MSKPKRPTLDTFASMSAPAQAEAGTVTQSTPVHAASEAKAAPKISVYLTAEEIRTLKLIGIDTGQKITDIGAIAIREWLERNGHARSFNA